MGLSIFWKVCVNLFWIYFQENGMFSHNCITVFVFLMYGKEGVMMRGYHLLLSLSQTLLSLVQNNTSS